MGWPFGGKEQATPEPTKPLAEKSPAEAETIAKASPSNDPAAESKIESVEEQEVPLPAVFEFGGSAVVAGVQMKGICVGDDPDQIRACLWRVDQVDKSTATDEEKYQILF